jgi:hypothetical protein
VWQQQHRERSPPRRQQHLQPQDEDEDEEEDDACACRASAPPPETVALAALKIAAGFLEDRRVDARWWARYVAAADVRVDARDVDLAVRCILVDVDYDLCAFSAEEVEKRRVWMMRGVDEAEAGPEQEREGSWQAAVVPVGVVV